ncbi:hypothetical protein GCM10022282_23950 [Agromyces indicus]
MVVPTRLARMTRPREFAGAAGVAGAVGFGSVEEVAVMAGRDSGACVGRGGGPGWGATRRVKVEPLLVATCSPYAAAAAPASRTRRADRGVRRTATSAISTHDGCHVR